MPVKKGQPLLNVQCNLQRERVQFRPSPGQTLNTSARCRFGQLITSNIHSVTFFTHYMILVHHLSKLAVEHGQIAQSLLLGSERGLVLFENVRVTI